MRLPSIAALALLGMPLVACAPTNSEAPDAGADVDAALSCTCPLGLVCDPNGQCTRCGNGFLDSGETCDPGLAATTDCGARGYQPGQAGCTDSCQWELTQCVPLATCGNGQLDPAELCDGASIKPGVDCADYGRTQGSVACEVGCAIDSSGCHTCGDGEIESNEACDDHDTSGGDGCSASCTVETGWQCAGSSVSTCTPKCGDGVKIGSETCDDGNANSQDGCSASCKVETDCTCTGSPSVCSCAWVQSIWTPPQYTYIDAGQIVVDNTGKPRVAWLYKGDDYTDPMTGYLREPAYFMYGERGTSSWTTSQAQTWIQPVTGSDNDDVALSFEGTSLYAYFHRVYESTASFAAGTKASSWTFAYDNPYYVRSVVRGGGAWHALVDAPSFANLRYRMGAPGAWTRDESISSVNVNDDPVIAAAPNGDVFMATVTRGSSNANYRMKITRRVDATTAWTVLDDVTNTAPAGACVYPIFFQPIALTGGDVMAFEQGFDKNKVRWLRAHVNVNGSWIVEDVANLSWLDSSCTTGGASYSNPKMVMASDTLGRPHILWATKAAVANGPTTTIEDHYRDATGWHTRTFPITNAAPLDVMFDGSGTTHLLTLTTANGTTRLSYARIDASNWMAL